MLGFTDLFISPDGLLLRRRLKLQLNLHLQRYSKTAISILGWKINVMLKLF
jgi:hypothetical protein